MIFIGLLIVVAGIFMFLIAKYSGKMSVDNVFSVSFLFGILFLILACLAFYSVSKSFYTEEYVLVNAEKIVATNYGEYTVKDNKIYYRDENMNTKVIPLNKVKSGTRSEEPYIEEFRIERKYTKDNFITKIDKSLYRPKVIYVLHY